MKSDTVEKTSVPHSRSGLHNGMPGRYVHPDDVHLTYEFHAWRRAAWALLFAVNGFGWVTKQAI